MIREDVPATPRKSMGEARKRRIWDRVRGVCWMCGKVAEVTGPNVRYDHRIPIELSGSEDDENVFPLHREPCDRIKTAADANKIAKMRRLRRKANPETRKIKPAIPSRPMQKGKTAWPKRPFEKRRS